MKVKEKTARNGVGGRPMARASHRHLVFALTTVVALLRAVAKDDNILRPWPPDCSTADNYTAGSQYQRNLAELLSRLPAAAGDNGWFYEGSAGAGADEVFGLVMCYADYNATACRDCLSRAPAGITTVCPGSRSVRAMYSPCVLRYSDTPIPATADLAILYSVYDTIPVVPIRSESARAAWVPLMSKLTGGVAASPLRLANGSTPFPGSQRMYGLAQCTRDLNASECSNCISSYTDRLRDLFANNTLGGVVRGYSCHLRYQVGQELGITLPPAPALPAPGKLHVHAAPSPSGNNIDALRNYPMSYSYLLQIHRSFLIFQDRDRDRHVRRFRLVLGSPGLLPVAPPATAEQG